MKVAVRFFAQFRELTGMKEGDVELPPGSTAADLFARFSAKEPRLEKHRGIALVARNDEYVRWDTPLADGDEVAFFPPVSGGR